MTSGPPPSVPFGAPQSFSQSTTTTFQSAAYFGLSTGESPTSSNPFAFVATNQNPPILQQQQKNATSYPTHDGFQEKIPATQLPLSSLHEGTNVSGQPPPITGTESQQNATHFQQTEDSAGQVNLPDGSEQGPMESCSNFSHPVHGSHRQSAPSAMDVFSYVGQGGDSASDFFSSLQPQSLPVQQNSVEALGGERSSSSAPSTGLHPLIPTTNLLTAGSQLPVNSAPQVTDHLQGQSFYSLPSAPPLDSRFSGAQLQSTKMQELSLYQPLPPHRDSFPELSAQHTPSTEVKGTLSLDETDQLLSGKSLKLLSLEEPTGAENLVSAESTPGGSNPEERYLPANPDTLLHSTNNPHPPSDSKQSPSSSDQHHSSSPGDTPLPPERPLSNADISSTTDLRMKQEVDRQPSYPVLGTNAEITSLHLQQQQQQNLPPTNAAPFVPLLPQADDSLTTSPKRGGDFAMPIVPSNAPPLTVLPNQQSGVVQDPEPEVRHQTSAMMSFHDFEGEGVEPERPLSHGSSMNQSISSLLDSQEDFARLSPVRLLPPAPETQLSYSPMAASHPTNPVVAPVVVHNHRTLANTEGPSSRSVALTSAGPSWQQPASSLSTTMGEVYERQHPAAFSLADIHQQQQPYYAAQFSMGGSSTSELELPPSLLGAVDSHSAVTDPSQPTQETAVPQLLPPGETQTDSLNSLHSPSETRSHIGRHHSSGEQNPVLPPPLSPPTNLAPPHHDPTSQASTVIEGPQDMSFVSATNSQNPPSGNFSSLPLTNNPLPPNPHHPPHPLQMAPPSTVTSYNPHPPHTASKGVEINPQMNPKLQEHPPHITTVTTNQVMQPPLITSTKGQSAPPSVDQPSQVLRTPPDQLLPPTTHTAHLPSSTQDPSLPLHSTTGSVQPATGAPPLSALVLPTTVTTALVSPELTLPSRGPLPITTTTTTSWSTISSSQALPTAPRPDTLIATSGGESQVTAASVTVQASAPPHISVPPAQQNTDPVFTLSQPVSQSEQDHKRTDSSDTGTQDRGDRDRYDYDRRPRYDDRHGHGYPGYYQDRHDPYPDHYREREDVYYRSDRMRGTYRDQDPYAYDRPRLHSRGPYDPYDRASEGYPEYTSRYDYEDPYRRRYDYRGRYPLHEEEYYSRRGGDFYEDGRRYDYDERFYDHRYGSYRGHYRDYPPDPHYDSRVQYIKQDPRNPQAGYEYGHEYEHEYPHHSQYDPSQYQPSQYQPSQYPSQYQSSQYQDLQYAEEHYGEQHQLEQEGNQEPQYAPEDFNPEASAIYGKQDNFEISQTFVDSPHTKLPQRTVHMQHESTAYYDQSVYGEYPAHYQQQPGAPYEQTDGSFELQQYYRGQPHQPEYYEKEDPSWVPVEVTPPPPARETPELYALPHLRASFGFGGQLVTLLPNNPKAHEPAVVEICSMKDLVVDSSMAAFVEEVEASPGPLIPGSTPKSEVIRYASKEAEKCREQLTREENEQVARHLEDEALLWDFLVLLCQQNGVVVASDITELLMRDRTLSVKSPTHIVSAEAQEESLAAFRQLLLTGRKKDALNYACSKSLWGHGLMLASRMDEQSRIYVVNRFAASLMTTDPLNTFYTLLLGQTPSVVKPDGLARAGDWRPHLAMMLSNRSSKLDNSCIVAMGDSLLSQGRLHAAHLCYHLGHVQFEPYGSTDSSYNLLGIDHSHLSVGTYPRPTELCKMEVYEFAMSLNKQEFSLPSFQTFKYLNVLKLVEAGFVAMALKYCEQISYCVIKNPQCYTPSFLFGLVELSAKLHHTIDPIGVVETELPSWILQLHQTLSETLSTDYTPSLRSSPSPAFSSVSQTYSSQPLSQPILGMGQYLTVPGRGSTEVSTANSSKEGSVVNLQVNVPSSGGTQQPSALALYATQVGQQPQLNGAGQTATGDGSYNQSTGVPDMTQTVTGQVTIATDAGNETQLQAGSVQQQMGPDGTAVGYTSIQDPHFLNIQQGGGAYMYQQGEGTAGVQSQYSQGETQPTYGSYEGYSTQMYGGQQQQPSQQPPSQQQLSQQLPSQQPPSHPQPVFDQTEAVPPINPSQMTFGAYPDGGAAPDGQTAAPLGYYWQQQQHGVPVMSGDQQQQPEEAERTKSNVGTTEPPPAGSGEQQEGGGTKEKKEKEEDKEKPAKKTGKGQ